MCADEEDPSGQGHGRPSTLVYQAYTPAGLYLAGPVDVLAKLAPQAKNIAIIYSKDNFSTACVNGLKKYAEGKGYKIVMSEGYDPATTDFSPYINKIPDGTDAVMGGGHFSDTTTLARQLYEKKVKTKLIGLLVGPPEPKFAELGEACIGVVGSSQWEPLARYSPEAAKKEGVEWFGPTVPEFIEAYKASTIRIPPITAPAATPPPMRRSCPPLITTREPWPD